MKWKRAQSDQPQTCSVRGCLIPSGDQLWIKRWRSERGTPWIESVYCHRCGETSRSSSGIIAIGPAIILALLVLSFVILPLAWPGHWRLYPLVFVATFAATAMILTRTFFWLFRNHPQVRSAEMLPPVQANSECST